jgi:hypothetical protein
MEPACRLSDGTPLWLTGEIRTPRNGESYWTPEGPQKAESYVKRRAWPILTASPLLPDPYLAGRIDQNLARGWSFTHEVSAGRELLKQARKHLWGSR